MLFLVAGMLFLVADNMGTDTIVSGPHSWQAPHMTERLSVLPKQVLSIRTLWVGVSLGAS